MLPQNKKQLAVERYHQTVKKLQNDPNKWLDFLKFSAKVHKYSFQDQVLLFANNPEVELVANLEQWNRYGRKIFKGEKSIHLLDEFHNHMKYVFDISQTWGNDIKVFDWNLDKQDKENLLEHWQEVTNNIPNFEKFTALDFKLQLTIERVLNSKVSDAWISNCAEYVINQRIGMQAITVDEGIVREPLTNNNFEDFMASVEQPVKEVLQEIEKTLEKEYEKERIPHYERIKPRRNQTTNPEPTLLRGSTRTTISSGGDTVQSPSGGNSTNSGPTGSDRENVSDETRRRRPLHSQAEEIRGDDVPLRQGQGERSDGENRQPVHEDARRESRTRVGNGADTALPDIAQSSQRDNPSTVQLNNEIESVTQHAPDFSFGSNAEIKQQLSLFGEPKEIEIINPISQTEVEPVENETYYTQEIIDAELLRWGSISGAKGRIYYLFLHEDDKRKRIKFLKEEYQFFDPIQAAINTLHEDIQPTYKKPQVFDKSTITPTVFINPTIHEGFRHIQYEFEIDDDLCETWEASGEEINTDVYRIQYDDVKSETVIMETSSDSFDVSEDKTHLFDVENVLAHCEALAKMGELDDYTPEFTSYLETLDHEEIDSEPQYVEIQEAESVFQSVEELDADGIRNMKKHKGRTHIKSFDQQGLD